MFVITIYIGEYYIPKKRSEMSGKACSSSGMTNATLAEAVVPADQLWETVIRC